MTTPCDYPVTTPFGQVPGYPVNGGYHKGVDYGCPSGTPLRAPATGRIAFINYNHPTMGNAVEIQVDTNLFVRYLHLTSVKYKVGTTVTEGTPIAISGNTGLSTGPHVHVDVYDKVNDQPYNYYDFQKYVKEEAMPADYATARIYAQEMLFRDMSEDEFNKFHKGKTRDQLFDSMRDAQEREDKLAYWKSLESNQSVKPTVLSAGVYEVK